MIYRSIHYFAQLVKFLGIVRYILLDKGLHTIQVNIRNTLITQSLLDNTIIQYKKPVKLREYKSITITGSYRILHELSFNTNFYQTQILSWNQPVQYARRVTFLAGGKHGGVDGFMTGNLPITDQVHYIM